MLSLNLPPSYRISSLYIMGFDIKVFTKEFKPYACMHHIVVVARPDFFKPTEDFDAKRIAT